MNTSRKNSNAPSIVSLLAVASLALACGGKEPAASDAGPSALGGASGLGGSSSVGGGGGAQLQWFNTCGYPSCRILGPDASAPDAGPTCPAIGSPCNDEGQTCGTRSDFNCGVIQVCARQDPTASPYGCPISSRQYKDGITYLDNAELQRLHENTLATRLATYTYKSAVADPTSKHLGFIIEDQPGSPAVDATHNRVDLYGYVSMVVASLQVQEKEIADLREQLKAARQSAALCSKGRR